jgi:hypothetical protein
LPSGPAGGLLGRRFAWNLAAPILILRRITMGDKAKGKKENKKTPKLTQKEKKKVKEEKKKNK